MAANASTFDAIETVFKQFGSGPDLYGAIKNLADAASPTLTPEQKLLAAADASVNIMKVADALGSMFTAYAGKLGMPANIASLVSNLNKAHTRMANQGQLEVSDVSALVSDVAAIASSLALGAAIVNPVLIPVAGALVLFGAATTVFGNTMDYRADKAKQLFIAEFGTQKLEAMNAYGDYAWGSDTKNFTTDYEKNPVMGPALQVIHAIDKNLALDAAVELIGRAGIGGWLNGGKQKEASDLLRVTSKTLGGGDLSAATDLKTYATQLETVWPLIQANAGQFRFITPAEIASSNSAKTDFGVFVALMQLNPVALVPTSATAKSALQATDPTLYASWLADKNARLYGDTTKALGHSDNWYADRAAMLAALVARNEQDIGGIVPGSQNLLYFDKASNTEVLVGAGSNLRTMTKFGGDGADAFDGGAFGDHLYGNAGDDSLNGLGGVKAFTLYLSVPAAVGGETKTIAANPIESCGEAIFCFKTDAANDGWMRRVA